MDSAIQLLNNWGQGFLRGGGVGGEGGVEGELRPANRQDILEPITLAINFVSSYITFC